MKTIPRILTVTGCCFLIASVLLAEPATALPPPKNLLQNPGFEQLDAANRPTGWKLAVGRVKSPVVVEAPHGGKTAMRLEGDGQSVAWQQEVAGLPTRHYMASGWFRANKLQISTDNDRKEYARFYFHILYKDRPYTDTTHAYVDIPPGTYDWKRLSVRLIPRTEWPIEKIRVTVTAHFSAGAFDFDDISLADAPLRSGAFATEWRNGSSPVVITDMGLCAPSKALSPKSAKRHWQLMSYEAEPLKGRMLWASDEANAPPLTLPLNTNGWHAVYVGLADPSVLGCHALLRLTSDSAYVPRTRTAGQIEETFFKVADLTGQSLHIAQESGGQGRSCGIAYVKLVPLTSDEVAAFKADRQDSSCRKLVTTIDGFSFIYSRRPTSIEALLPEVETYRDTDFDTLILQMGGADMVNYPSKVGEMCGQNLTVFPRRGDRFYAEAIRELARKGINPTKVLIQGAHSAGLKVHVGLRPAAWVHSEPFSEFFNSRFYQMHPDWRCVDRDGTPVARMSLAVPQVRSHLVEVLREAIRFGADGASILYNRGVPLVLFEKPFCDLFKQRYDADAMAVPEDDKRVLQLRAELLTTFMREVRSMLDSESQRRADGTHLALSAFVMPDESDNIKFGFNLRDWVAQGLVNDIFPCLSTGGVSARKYDMKFFTEVCRPRNVRVRPVFVAWNSPDLHAVMRQTLDLYDSGADGITVWDGNSGADRTDRWSVISRMGHLDELRESAETRPPRPVTIRFQKISGMVLDGRYRPNWGY